MKKRTTPCVLPVFLSQCCWRPAISRPEAVSEQVRRGLLGLTSTAEGRAILAGMASARFHAADDASYNVVRDYVARFEREIRPVESAQ
jgi:hypothetical protein